ncbi:hypothetical protein SLEP1_g34451 [Rubroshorea leprosula]|uniref:Uncharacterized protein n=1 Tax=Rubroshorea leprosula TaxID=152421 RepID=A0AAV5KK97_9ROSI|nr:hypothetical protein SLEP1_g34451 [Rubroshorea leprosula]
MDAKGFRDQLLSSLSSSLLRLCLARSAIHRAWGFSSSFESSVKLPYFEDI